MVARSLVKLIDEAIIPAVALIVGKMTGLALAIYILDLPATIITGPVAKFLPSVHFANVADYILAENYSNLAMFVMAAIGTIFVLARAHFFHESHIHPRLQAKLARLNLETLIAPSYHLYHQAVIWLTFLWLTVAFLILSTIIDITYPVISAIAFIVAANFSALFAMDIEKEIEITKLNQN